MGTLKTREWKTQEREKYAGEKAGLENAATVQHQLHVYG